MEVLLLIVQIRLFLWHLTRIFEFLSNTSWLVGNQRREFLFVLGIILQHWKTRQSGCFAKMISSHHCVKKSDSHFTFIPAPCKGLGAPQMMLAASDIIDCLILPRLFPASSFPQSLAGCLTGALNVWDPFSIISARWFSHSVSLSISYNCVEGGREEYGHLNTF